MVCFLDVLGFETKFNLLGLGGILEKYEKLIQVINEQNESTEKWFGTMNFSEGAYWTAEQDAFISQRIYGTYASDSILLFANADFPENSYPKALNLTVEERSKRAKDPGTGWMYQTIPCDNFLNVCNEIICHSIEIGFPLRGCIAMGEAVLHLDRRIFLGKPLLEAVRLENSQVCIGTVFTKSFMLQLVPKRYQISYNSHFKAEIPPNFSGTILDWPRHWRNTRKDNLQNAIDLLNINPEYDEYYKKTQSIIDVSNSTSELFNSPNDIYIKNVYPQFSSELLELFCRPVRIQKKETD